MKKDDLPLNLEPHGINEKTKTSMKTRIIVALIALCIILPIVFVGTWFIFAAALILAGICAYELITVVKGKYNYWLIIGSILIATVLVAFPLLRSFYSFDPATWSLYKIYNSLYLSVGISAIGAFALFLMVISYKDFKVQDCTFIFTMIIICALGVQGMLVLRYLPCSLAESQHLSTWNAYYNFESSTLLIYTLLGSCINDIGAYFFGVFFGKHKLNERISPKKTWEGFFGGVVCSFIFTFAFAMILAATGHPILSFLGVENWYIVLILSVLMPIIGTLGDLFFSSIKRNFDIKDFGRLLPEHGGLLDRIDSSIFVCAAAAIYVVIVGGCLGYLKFEIPFNPFI